VIAGKDSCCPSPWVAASAALLGPALLPAVTAVSRMDLFLSFAVVVEVPKIAAVAIGQIHQSSDRSVQVVADFDARTGCLIAAVSHLSADSVSDQSPS